MLPLRYLIHIGVVCLCGIRGALEFEHDNALRLIVDHPTIGPTEPEGLFHVVLIWTLMLLPQLEGGEVNRRIQSKTYQLRSPCL
jgi:hypothetical protein